MAGQDRLDNADEEEMSTSGVSTVNSTKLKPTGGDTKYLNEEFSKLKVQNVHLMQNLLESHKLYQALLKSTIEEQRLNLDLLRNFTAQLTNATVLYERSVSQGYVKKNWRICKRLDRIYLIFIFITVITVIPVI